MSILVDPAVYSCPPDNCSEREAAVYELLSRLGIVFTRVSHEPAMTIADCADIDAALGVNMCKNLLLCEHSHGDRSQENSLQRQYYLVMLSGDRAFRSAALSRAVGAPRLSFAPGSVMEPLLGVAPGSLTVLGLKNDADQRVRLVIDRTLAASEYTGCHPCVNTSSLKIKTQDLLRVFLPYARHKPDIAELA